MISRKHQCLFTHIPKTAGKSMLALFDLPPFGKDYVHRHAHIEKPYGHKPLRAFVHSDAFAFFKFAFVRNPWERLVSAFFYLDAGGCNARDAAFRDRHLARYGSDFHHFLRDLPGFLGHQHFAPQWTWICDESGHLMTDFIGRCERMDDDVGFLRHRLGLTADFPWLNASRHPPYRQCYDAAGRQIAGDIYRRDQMLFGYEF